MRRIALLLAVLLLAAQAYSAQLVLDIEGPVSMEVQEAVRRALERSMLPRIRAQHSLTAIVQATLLTDEHTLTLQYQDKELSLKFLKNTRHLEQHLVSALAYDGLVLLEDQPSLSLDFHTVTGFGSSIEAATVKENTVYRVYDADFGVRGRLLVSKVMSDQQIALFSQIEGKELGLGMAIDQEKQLPISLAVSMDTSRTLSLSLGYSKRLSVYPFSFSVGVGTVGFDTIHLAMQVKADVPISSFFGTRNHLARNISLSSAMTLAYGYAFSEARPYALASGSVFITYHSSAWAFSLGAGNQIVLSKDAILARGLFLNLSTAYTYSL